MSLHEYVMSQEIAKEDYPFYALIMAAMRQADSLNILLLSEAFEGVHDELRERYNAPDGCLDGADRRWLDQWRLKDATR